MPNLATAKHRHRGWYYDQVNQRLVAAFNGTEVFDFDANDMNVAQNLVAAGTLNVTGAVTLSSTIEVTGAQTFTGAAEFSAAVGVADDISLELGTTDDSVFRHKSGTLAGNTTLTDVLAGTPVSQALAANSLMISNITANGDIAVYVNTGTVSEQAIFIDGSAKLLALGQTGWSANLIEGAVKLTLGTPTAFASTQPTNTLVLKVGTAPAGAIVTSVGLFTDGTTMKKIIADGTVTDVQT